jgi:hypothetical protein
MNGGSFVEIMLRAEAALERRLCGLAICQPKVIASLKIRPEVDLGAKEFFAKFDQRREEILASDDLRAIQIAVECCPTTRDFDRFWRAIEDVNTVDLAPNFGSELVAARTARKAIHWVESSDLLAEVLKD